ncbi:hypothetical protein [Bacillus sp. JCM 19041]|uniref:hypothetical protein n=1 Tax=Bacillus sp. JCM 19041 TaxID=1460637 RepID=UPI000ADE37D2
MAKKTMEELLEEALVPEEERPYEVPENWVWTNIDSISKLVLMVRTTHLQREVKVFLC